MCPKCGFEISPGMKFCTKCGSQVGPAVAGQGTADAPAQPSVQPAEAPVGVPTTATAPATPAVSRKGIAVAGVGLLAVLGAGTALLVTNRGDSTPPVSAASASASPSPSASKSSTPAGGSGSASASPTATAAPPVAQLAPSSAPPAPQLPAAPAPAPVPMPAAPTESSISGIWTGSLPGNQYYDLFVVMDESQGVVNAKVTMTEYKAGAFTGGVGTELMSGSRNGSKVYLRGYAWEPGAPSNWSLDTFDLTLSADGNSMSGDYFCGGCDLPGTLSLSR